MTEPHRIVIVGGGAGGLELATRAGDRFGRRARATVTLVDKNETHLWKPLLHEIAAGSMDIHAHQLDYLAQARWHHFNFCCGSLESLDRSRREITVAPLADERGVEVIPRRTLSYDTLVIAIGSVANTFGVPGVAEHAYALESAAEADRFPEVGRAWFDRGFDRSLVILGEAMRRLADRGLGHSDQLRSLRPGDEKGQADTRGRAEEEMGILAHGWRTLSLSVTAHYRPGT